MKEIIKFEDFRKFSFLVGDVKELHKEKVIVLPSKTINLNSDISLKSDEQVVVSVVNGKIVLPFVKGNIFLVPDSKVENGTIIS